MRELLDALAGWEAEGVGVGRAVVVRTFGSAPRATGAVLLVTADGRVAGSVSGGCVEGAVVEELARARTAGRSRVIRYGISDERAWDVGLACGGTIDVLVEALVRAEAVAAAQGADGGRRGGRAIVTPLPADAPGPAFGPHVAGDGEPPAPVLIVHDDGRLEGTLGGAALDGDLVAGALEALERGASGTLTIGGRQLFVEAYAVPPRLVVVGADEVARSLVRFARDLGYETVVVDGRAAFATAARFPGVERLIVGWLDEVAEEIDLGPADAVAVLAHDVKFDEPAIVEALRRGCRYVGAIGSRATQSDRRARLLAAGVGESDVARLRGPIGLDLGGRAPAETALAIMAEVIAARHAGSGLPLSTGLSLSAGRVATPARVAAVVLAAGAASRFGGVKALAPLAGRPVLGHVLDAVREAGVDDVVVVLGDAADEVERGIAWRGERCVVNPEPSAGISSSLRVGLDQIGPAADAALVVLGDQPLVRPAVIRALVDRAATSPRPIVVPRYAGGGGPNPVLIRRGAWWLADAADGDRGLGPAIAAHPELVEEVPVPGDNPDVDTPADLAAIAGGAPGPATAHHPTMPDVLRPSVADALAAWAARVRANAEQVDRVREVADAPDFYGPTAAFFRADPRRGDEPLLDDLLAIARPEDAWLDIGAGAGRYALPLALAVREVVAVEPSPGMAEALREGMAEHGIANLRVIEGGWPPADPTTGTPIPEPPRVDVALIAHLGYDIERLGPFLRAMEAAAARLCVAVLMERQPSSVADPFWPIVHGEERVALPALREFLAVLTAFGRSFEVRLHERAPRTFETEDEAIGLLRRQLWIADGGEKDARFVAAARERLVERDGRFVLRDQRAGSVGLVTWTT